MSVKFSDTQLVMLSAAAQRDDRSLTPLEKLKGGAAHKVAMKLVAAGLVREVKAKAGMPVWGAMSKTRNPMPSNSRPPERKRSPSVQTTTRRLLLTKNDRLLGNREGWHRGVKPTPKRSPRRAPKRSRRLARRASGPSWRMPSRYFEHPKARQ
jgi:hypothetical protein